MYQEHFGLQQEPFSIAPDPRFLFLSDAHNEALAHLMYGFSHGGFVLITGEVGTGKTTLLRNLLDRTPPDLDVAFILNPRLTVRELLETLCDELGVGYRGGELQSVKQYIDVLNKHLLKTHQAGRSTVVIIDEAQNLSPAVLEQVRLLTNLETNEKKLLRIILLGQPELAEMLDRTELRQLAQRITARYHLNPLSREDVRQYVNHRLARAGGHPGIFSDGAVHTLYRVSKGTPRLINVIADRAMLGAYVEGRVQVDRRLIRYAAKEVLGKGKSQRNELRNYLVGASLVVVAVIALMAWAYLSPRPDTLVSSTAGAASSSSNTRPASASIPKTPAGTTHNSGDATTAAQPADTGTQNNLSATSSPALTTAPQPQPPAVQMLSSDVSRPPGSSTTVQRQAYRAVFAAWGAEYNIDAKEIPCDFAPLAGLQCLGRRGGWSEIKQLDTPVVLELWDERSVPYYAAVLAYRDDNYILSIGERQVAVQPRQLRDHWYGNYVLLWQTPPNYLGSLREGDNHPTVAWLHRHLGQLMENSDNTADTTPDNVFDAELTQMVLQFQTREGLLADGIVGPLTWIRLSDRLNLPAPKLTQSTAAS